MNPADASRRAFVRIVGKAGLGLSLGLAVPGGMARAAEALCQDPATLPLSQRTRRRSLGYVEPAADPARRCGLCAFFTGTTEGCGTCQMLTGGTVSAWGVCTSFATKANG